MNDWCSIDPQTAITTLMNGGDIDNRSCESGIAEHYELVRKLGLGSTPTLVFADGSVHAGYLAPEALFRKLLSAQP